jgi:phosphatidylglycerophosphate synthase
VRTVRSGPTFGLVGQAVLLLALAATVGLGPAGWTAGAGYGLITFVALSRGLARTDVREAGWLGPADRITLARATLVGCVAALTADSLVRSVPVALLVGIAATALALDFVDGVVARRTATASALGARFDMEVDASLILVLSVYVVPTAGVWVLAIGAMRYVYVMAGWCLPWLRGPLPPRYWRKVVAAVQGVVLVFAASGILPAPLLKLALVAALALLVESFGRDVVWLWRQRGRVPARARSTR